MSDETYRLKAVVLGRQPMRENDLLVDLLTEEQGRLKLVARGAKKFRSKIAAHVEPFCLVEAMAIRGRKEDYLGSCLSAEVFAVLKSDLMRLKMASEAVILVKDAVREREPVPSVFKALIEYLSYLNTVSIEPAKFQADIFAIKVYESLGLLDLSSLTISENCINLINAIRGSFNLILAKKVSNRAKLAIEIDHLVKAINDKK
jgi:DNA repair protein RecO (recombination protein O)